MSPIAFLEGIKEAGLHELSEMEAACLLRVLAKPELENAIILNEFIMIMENFGVIDNYEDDDDIDDYVRSDDEDSKIGSESVNGQATNDKEKSDEDKKDSDD